MIRKSHITYLWSMLVVPDFILAASGLLLAWLIRFSTPAEAMIPAADHPSLTSYLPIAVLHALLWSFFLFRKGEYYSLSCGQPARTARYLAIWTCGLKAELMLLALSAVFRELLSSRITHLLAFLLTGLMLMFWREVVRWIMTRHPVYRTVLICAPEQEKELQEILRAKIIGLSNLVCIPWTNASETITQQIEKLRTDLKVEYVFITQLSSLEQSDEQKETFFAVLNLCERTDISVYMIPEMFDVFLRRDEIFSFTNIALIRLRDAFIHPVYRVFKRAMDILMSIVTLVVGLPFWLLIALRIKLQDGGPVFYRQCRIGLHGKPFNMIKFRTMRIDADSFIQQKIANGELDESLVFNIRKDPRVTPFGSFLRRWSLDEIPQMLNVLRGEMSVVGPRPERKELVDRYSPLQRRRLKAYPGITGLQQVLSRGDPSLEYRIHLDLLYINKQSFLFDLYILVRTIFVVILGHGVK